MTSSSNLEELDTAVDNAVIAFSEANKAVFPHVREIGLTAVDIPLTPADAKVSCFSETLVDLYIAGDERAKADEDPVQLPANPYAGARFIRAAINRVRRYYPGLTLGNNTNLFGENSVAKAIQRELYIKIETHRANQNRKPGASQEKPCSDDKTSDLG